MRKLFLRTVGMVKSEQTKGQWVSTFGAERQADIKWGLLDFVN